MSYFGRSVLERLHLESAFVRPTRPGTLIRALASTPRLTGALARPEPGGGVIRRVVRPPAPTNVHRPGPVGAAGPMITPQDVTRLVVPRSPVVSPAADPVVAG
ncbi:hypothetical protein KIH74_04725 [Kineosporia sp. J2-2]|uniref:Uncharacterized protein n=1 Tax=Kineosporia corallincola TaxID=2835133 RepID=A0ABS5TAX0_9ACTN|nr:hypothetical protein [Kineosporia corallincola]MBT0768214.1 hypothetical protein [Kineosporia corallincola]